MNLKAFYQRIRQTEESIEDEFLFIKSLPTEDGGKAGRLVEVPRSLAARMIIEETAELATAKECAAARTRIAQERKQEASRRRAAQVQFTVISDTDLKTVQEAARSSRKG